MYFARSPLLNVNSPVDLISNNLIVSSFTCEMEKIIKRLTEESTDAFTHTNCVWKKKKEKFWRYKRRLFLVKYFAWRILCLLERFYDYIIAKYRGKFSCDWKEKNGKEKFYNERSLPINFNRFKFIHHLSQNI